MGQWWNWKPEKTALELLFWRGDLMVTRRDNFQRIYDLTENVLPDGTDTSMPEKDELGRFLVRRALETQAIASINDIVRNLHAVGREVIKDAVESMLSEEEILPVSIEGEFELYGLPDVLSGVSTDNGNSKIVHILSPFDNLIILRDRISRFFDFEYALECYTPRVKRRYGYFVMPVLWGTRFVGRLDPKADRKRGILILRSLEFEEGFDEWEEFLPAFALKLVLFARFNGCSCIELENVKPGFAAEPLIGLAKNFERENTDDCK
mgnify:CR=1 FL=1